LTFSRLLVFCECFGSERKTGLANLRFRPLSHLSKPIKQDGSRVRQNFKTELKAGRKSRNWKLKTLTPSHHLAFRVRDQRRPFSSGGISAHL
jgi:hypothetical protein